MLNLSQDFFLIHQFKNMVLKDFHLTLLFMKILNFKQILYFILNLLILLCLLERHFLLNFFLFQYTQLYYFVKIIITFLLIKLFQNINQNSILCFLIQLCQ